MNGWADFYVRAEEIGAEAAWQERLEQERVELSMKVAAREAAHRARNEAFHRRVRQQNIAEWSERARRYDGSTYSPLYTAWLEVDTGIFEGTEAEVHEHLRLAALRSSPPTTTQPRHRPESGREPRRWPGSRWLRHRPGRRPG